MNVFFNFITNREYCNLKQLGEKAMYNTMFFLETDLVGWLPWFTGRNMIWGIEGDPGVKGSPYCSLKEKVPFQKDVQLSFCPRSKHAMDTIWGQGPVSFLLDAKFFVKCFTCVILFDF